MYMKMNFRTVAFGTSVLFALAIVVMPVFVLDRALVWDDWVWIHSSPEQLRDVAIQLGFWWLADLNVFIYSLENPNLFLSSVAFCSHVVSIAVLVRFFVKFDVLNDVQCGFWAACCILSPYVLVRYSNSVAFYNLYFSCFVCAAYLFVIHENKFAKLLSVILFSISFSLNSLIPAYFVIVLFSDRPFFSGFFERMRLVGLKSTQGWGSVCNFVFSRVLKIWPLMSLPFMFYVIKFLSPYKKKEGNPYELYNVPDFNSLLWSPLIALKETLQLFFDVIWYGLVGLDSLALLLMLVAAGVVFSVLLFFKRLNLFCFSNDSSSPFCSVFRRNVLFLFVFSCVLVFPYVLVGKPPVLGSFIESRHFLAVEPFVFAMAILLISNIGYWIGRLVFSPRLVAVVLMVFFSAFCVWRVVLYSSFVWWENKVSNYIIDVIRSHKSSVKFWVFDDQIPVRLGVERWNYVYTGFLISAFGEKDNFGISKGEYLGWNQPVKLLNDPYYRRRYNIEKYVHQDSYNSVVIKPLRDVSANVAVLLYLLEKSGLKAVKMASLISVNVFPAFGCVDEAVSLFSTGVVNEEHVSLGEASYCQIVINNYCESIRNGDPVLRLSQMEYAYAVQKYPSFLAADGLHVFDVNTDFKKVTERCTSADGWVRASE